MYDSGAKSLSFGEFFKRCSAATDDGIIVYIRLREATNDKTLGGIFGISSNGKFKFNIYMQNSFEWGVNYSYKI